MPMRFRLAFQSVLGMNIDGFMAVNNAPYGLEGVVIAEVDVVGEGDEHARLHIQDGFVHQVVQANLSVIFALLDGGFPFGLKLFGINPHFLLDREDLGISAVLEDAGIEGRAAVDFPLIFLDDILGFFEAHARQGAIQLDEFDELTMGEEVIEVVRVDFNGLVVAERIFDDIHVSFLIVMRMVSYSVLDVKLFLDIFQILNLHNANV